MMQSFKLYTTVLQFIRVYLSCPATMACILSRAPCQTDFHMMCVLFIMLNMVTGLFHTNDNVFHEPNVFFPGFLSLRL